MASRAAKAPAPTAVLDFDSRTLRVVLAGGARVVAAPLAFATEADRVDPVALGGVLAKALEQLKLKPGPVVMGLPRAQVVLKTLLLPVIADVSELASVVHLQVGRDLPFRLADAVVEALAHGLPVVATACEGPMEVLDNGTFGQVVPKGDTQAMTDALERALEDPHDPLPRIQRASCFSFEEGFAEWERLVDAVATRT